jgi:hypothetical protein
VFHDFGEELVVNLIELAERGLECGLIFAVCLVEILLKLIGGVMEEHLGVLEALGVVGEAHVDELGVVIDFFEGGTGLVDVTADHLLAGDLGHCVDELSVEEALISWTGLLSAEFELSEGLGIGKIFVDVRGDCGDRERETQRQGEKKCRVTKVKFHNAPQRERKLLRVFKSEEAVAGFPLFIWKLAVCHG